MAKESDSEHLLLHGLLILPGLIRGIGEEFHGYENLCSLRLPAGCESDQGQDWKKDGWGVL